MPIDRRSILSAGLGAGIGAGLSGVAANAGPRSEQRLAVAEVPAAGELGQGNIRALVGIIDARGPAFFIL